MNYIYQYDIAAIIISLAGIISFFARKTVVTRLYKVFGFEIIIVLISSITDLMSIFTIADPTLVSIRINYLINIVYVSTTVISSFLLYLCVYYATEDSKEGSLVLKLLFSTPLILSIFLIVSTPLTKLVFWFDDNLVYTHGPVFPFLFVISGIYLLCIFIRVFFRRRDLPKEQMTTLVFYALVSIITMIVQLLIKNLMIVGFMASITTLHLFLTVENPIKYIDDEAHCFNRNAFLAQLKVNFSKNRRFKLIALEISGLNDLTNVIGQENEIALLKKISKHLFTICKSKNLFRISSRRFVLMINDDGKIQKEIILKIKDLFNEPFRINSMEIAISDFITYITCPKDSDNPNDVVDLLENTLAELKGSESGIVVPVNKQILVQKRRENQILQVLKKAIRRTEFEVFFQPIWSLSKNKFTTAEALIRLKLQNDEYGYIGPEEFIPIAEKNGLILPMGEFVFENVCRFLVKEKIWDKGIEFIHVNLSAVQCMQDKLYQQLLSIMDAYHLDYKYIHFEVTETAAVISSEKLLNNMNKLIEQGIEFALDDYGTGFSNTSSILNYPFHAIKLDKSMFKAGLQNKKSTKIVEHTIKMVKSLDMEVIAEGIEKPEQAIYLKRIGCDYIQGYLFSKPIPGKKFIELLNETETNGITE